MNRGSYILAAPTRAITRGKRRLAGAALLTTLALTALPGAPAAGAQGPVDLSATPQPVRILSINDVEEVEPPPTGTKTLTFTVTLNVPPAAGQQVTVQFRTEDGTARAADGDYQPIASGTLEFAAGQLEKPLPVQINADGFDGEGRSKENFTVRLTQATNAVISKGAGTGTLLDFSQLPVPPKPSDPNPPDPPCGWDPLHPCEGLKPEIKL